MTRRGAAKRLLPVVTLLTTFLANASNAADPSESKTRHPSMPKTSVVRLETQVSLADIERRVDAQIPRTAGSPDRFIVYNDSLEIRYGLNRDTLSIELDGYDCRLTFHAGYWMTVRGRNGLEFGEAHCGTPEEPIDIAMGYRGRIGWENGWKIGIRLEAEGNVFAFRCKPIPPGHNFTRFLERQVQEQFHKQAGRLFLDEIRRFDGIRPMIETAWAALQEPQDLHEGQVWMNWTPVTIEADPLGGTGNALDLRISFITDPSIHVGERGEFSVPPVPDPVVRVAEDDTRIPVDVTLSLAEIGRHIGERLASSEFAAVQELRIGGAGREIVVDVSPANGPRGAILAGTVSFDADTSAFRVNELDWRPGGLDSFRKTYPGLDAALFREKIRSELAFDVHDELTARRQLLPKAVNDELGPFVWARGAITHFLAEDPVITETSLTTRHWGLGPMWLTVKPASTGGGEPTPGHDSPKR